MKKLNDLNDQSLQKNLFLTKQLNFRHAYSPQYRLSLSFAGQGRTKQSFKDECDINTIMGRFARTGSLEHLAKRTPTYGDVQDIDFQGAMDIVASAREMFADLPSKLRDRFGNDPGKMLEFVQDEQNRAEALSLGLLRASTEALATPPSTQATDAPAATTPVSETGTKTS